MQPARKLHSGRILIMLANADSITGHMPLQPASWIIVCTQYHSPDPHMCAGSVLITLADADSSAGDAGAAPAPVLGDALALLSAALYAGARCALTTDLLPPSVCQALQAQQFVLSPPPPLHPSQMPQLTPRFWHR